MVRKILVTKKLVVLIPVLGFLLAGPVRCEAAGDFNGDGKDDIITFIRDSYTGDGRGDVCVALSTGSSFGAGQKWHEHFCLGLEIPAVGDFDGDGRDDIVAFVRDTQGEPGRGDVFVALSAGSSFSGTGWIWHDFFCIGNEIPGVGDFDGDGKDDIITFIRDSYDEPGRGDVYVALSTGGSFVGAGTWHDFFCVNTEIPAVGDFNGDGKDDIIAFARDTWGGDGRGDVFVALSTGSSFSGTGAKWHDFFCIGNEIPVVGDFDGDGKDDIAAFARGNLGKVFVALSTGSSFTGTGLEWTQWLATKNGVPDCGDFNGDGKDDALSFLHETWRGHIDAWVGNVQVARSDGSEFDTRTTWHDYFCVLDEVPTTFAAVLPYYMYSTTFENTSVWTGGYTSNEEERFEDNVADFLVEFADTWPYAQFFWAYPDMLAENHLLAVDAVDIAYVSGHGSPSSVTLCDGQKCDLSQCAWGSWSSNSRRGDLEYIAFESCKVCRLTGSWWERWLSTPHKKGPFSGLHVACGFHSNHYESPVWELSDGFAENLEAGYNVRWAWLEETDDEDDYTWGVDSEGSAIYLLPHKDEKYWEHNTYDRWYHHSDYIMEAQYWDY